MPNSNNSRNLNRLWRRLRNLFLIAGLAIIHIACAGGGVGPNADRPLRTVDDVDLERFAGLWYVIESMPTPAEDGAHDATETYQIRPDGLIDIEFSFLDGGFDGPRKTITQLGWVHDESSRAEWRVRPIWPLSLAYLILEIGPDYRYSVVGHPSKNYVWIMSREPLLSESTREEIRKRLAEAGYDVAKINRVPQRPPQERPPQESPPQERLIQEQMPTK